MPVSQNKSAMCGALLVFLCSMSAQADNEDAIARCARLAAVSERILCLEDALRHSCHEVDLTPVAKATSVPANETPPANENFGLKEKRPPKDENAIRVTVISVRENLNSKFVFETENGQVWLQTDQRKVRYRDIPFEAEISPASMGSFFLKPVAGGVSIRVNRDK